MEIGYATLTLSNSTNAAINGYRIVIENGDQVFQYDEYGNSPVAEKLKDPIQIKPLICHFFNPTGLEIPNGNYTLKIKECQKTPFYLTSHTPSISSLFRQSNVS